MILLLWDEGFERFEALCELLFKFFVFTGEIWLGNEQFELLGESLIVVYEQLATAHAPSATWFVATWATIHIQTWERTVPVACVSEVHCLGCVGHRRLRRSGRRSRRKARQNAPIGAGV